MLYDVSLDMSSTLEVDELFHRDRHCRQVDRRLPHLLDLSARREARRAAAQNVIRSNEREHQKLALPLGTGLVGTAAQMNVPVRSGNVLEDPRYLNVHPETRSELCVPLKHKGKVIGVVDLEAPRRITSPNIMNAS